MLFVNKMAQYKSQSIKMYFLINSSTFSKYKTTQINIKIWLTIINRISIVHILLSKHKFNLKSIIIRFPKTNQL